MMPLENWFAFATASVLLLAVPGPTVLMVVGHSLTHGRHVARSLVAAVCLGDATCAGLSLTGLALFLQGSEFGLAPLQAIGGLFLAGLGIGLLRASAIDPDRPVPPKPSLGQHVFVGTYLVTALNPKGLLFFPAFVPSFLSPQHSLVTQLLVLAVTFVALATLSAALYARMASSVHGLSGSNRVLVIARRVSGVLLLLVGCFALHRLTL